VKAFILAAQPASIRVIGQAPVIGKTVFDMASDGEIFRVADSMKINSYSVPLLRANEQQTIENLRPANIFLDALLWPEIRKEESVTGGSLTTKKRALLRTDGFARRLPSGDPARIWFDRFDLPCCADAIARHEVCCFRVSLADWQPLENAASQSSPAALRLV